MSSIRPISLSAACGVPDPVKNLMQQTRSRIRELAQTVDPGGKTVVRMNTDGTYEITAKSNDANAERLKSEIAKTFAEDDTLTSLLEEYRAEYQKMLEKNGQKLVTGYSQTPPSGGAVNESGDTAEISDKARAMLASQNGGVDGNDGQKHQFTMTIDRDILEANEPPVSLANRYFLSVRDELQRVAEETGEFENDYIIQFDEKNDLFIAEVTGRSGAVENQNTAAEKSTIESLLQSINEAMKSDADESDSNLVKTLRRFIDVAGRAEATPKDNANTTQAIYKLPFTIWGSTTRG